MRKGNMVMNASNERAKEKVEILEIGENIYYLKYKLNSMLYKIK